MKSSVTMVVGLRFKSEGFELAGVFRVPDRRPPEGGWPGIVLTGPLSGVKDQVVGNYAGRMAEYGFATLVFDHRRFGESSGEPRCHEDSAGKLADLRDALSVLAARPEVNAERIGALGVCLGGGYALRFAAFDPRVRAVACVAGGFNDPHQMRAGMGVDGYRETLAYYADAAARESTTGKPEYVLAVDDGSGQPAVMQGAEPAAYYLTERGASPHWENRLTLQSVRELITMDLAIGVDFLDRTPLLVVHGTVDAYCSPEGAQAVHDRVQGPKRLVWLEAQQHIDLYDVDAYVGPAIEHCADWFAEHL